MNPARYRKASLREIALDVITPQASMEKGVLRSVDLLRIHGMIAGYYSAILNLKRPKKQLALKRRMSYHVRNKVRATATKRDMLLSWEEGVKLRDAELSRQAAAQRDAWVAYPRDAWHEDVGNVLWWTVPITEPAYCGTPLDDDFPERAQYWTVLPAVIRLQDTGKIVAT